MMKRTILSLFAAVALFVPAAGAQVTAQLQVQPDRMLPGVPPWMLIRVVNGSTAPLQLRNAASLEVAPPSGARFFAEWQNGQSSESFTDEQQPLLRVAAGATNDLILASDVSLSTPAFFFDRRLNVPGTYLVRIVLFRDTATGTIEKVTTNDVTFIVEQPAGEDALVWNRMQQLAGGLWSSDSWATHGLGLAWEIYAQHRSSRYFPYVAAFKPSVTLEEKLQVIEQAIATNPSGPIADALQLSAAAVHQFASSEAFRAKQIERAYTEAQIAHAIAEDVRSRSTFPFMRTTAATAIANLTTTEQLHAYHEYVYNEPAPPPPPTTGLAVIPTTACVDVVGKTLVARFGYENPNSIFKVIPGGDSNQIRSSAKNSKQTFTPPQRFEPGIHQHVYSAIDNADVLTWVLDGTSVSAGRDLPRCSPPANQQPVRPLADCVKKSGNGVAAMFGYQNPNSYAVVIAPGPDNRTTPPDHNTDPPSLFLPGLHHDVWTAKVKGSTVLWFLQGASATAPATGVPDCRGQ